MAVQPLPKMGTQSLYVPSLPVQKFDTPELHTLLQDMRDTMEAAHGVGIAAPQIGVNLQVFMLGFEETVMEPAINENTEISLS